MYGNVIRIKGDYNEYFHLIEALYDLKTKSISSGIDVNIYPYSSVSEFKVGESILYQKGNRCLKSVTIENIVFGDYSLVVKKGKKC